jgi:outer membrane protein assembly factor BamB
MKRTVSIMILLCLMLSMVMIFNIQDREMELERTVETNQEETVRNSDTWEMFSHDLLHTSNTTANAPDTNNVLWYNLTDQEWEIYSSPIVSDGRVFVGTRSSYLYCFDENTGETLWSRYFALSSWGMCASVTCANGYVYTGSEDTYMYCLYPNNGTTKWKFKTGGAVWSCAAIVNGKVYVGSVDKYFYCLNESDGSLVWKYLTKDSTYGYQDYGISSSPAISNGKVFFGACDGDTYALPLDDPNGDKIIDNTEKLWEFNTGCYIYASPTVFNGKVYIGTGSYSKMAGAPEIYKLYCLDETTGVKAWEFTAGSYILATPSIGYGKLYIGSMDGVMYCLPLEDPNDNGVISSTEVIWKYDTLGNEWWGSPAIANGRLYIASGVPYWVTGNGDYRMFCFPLDDPNGNGIIAESEIIWDYALTVGSITSPCVVNGKVFISTFDGYVYCFGEDTIPPKVLSKSPAADETDVLFDADITMTFSESVSGISASTITVVNGSLASVPGAVSYNASIRQAIFDPTLEFDEYETYTVTVDSSIKDAWDNLLDGNGDGTGGDDHVWSFTSACYPPVISPIPTQRPVEAEDWDLNMSHYATDPNTPFEELVFTENSSYGEVNGNLITFNYPNGVTEEIVNVTASDGVTTVWQDVSFIVKQTNDPPEISEIPIVECVEDIDKVVDISPYVSDVDNDIEELILFVNSPYAKASGMEITFNYPNGILTDVVNLTVEDGIKRAYRDVEVEVTPVNDPPVISGVPDAEGIEDLDLLVNVTRYISDIDNEKDELNITTDSNYSKSIKIGTGKSTLHHIILNYPEEVLSEELNITVSDGELTDFQIINISIDPTNDPPVAVLDIPDVTFKEDTILHKAFDLGEYFFDPDGDDLTYMSESVNVGVTILISAEVSFEAEKDWYGEEEVLFRAFDQQHAFVETTINVTVESVNDAPILFAQQGAPDHGNTDTPFIFTVTYTDVDGDDAPTVEVLIDEKPFKMTPVEDSADVEEILFTYETKLGEGEHTYSFRCDDNSGESNSTAEAEGGILEVEGTGSGIGTGGMSLMIPIMIIIILLIVVIGVIVVVVLMKKKKKPEEMQGPPTPEFTEPSTQPSPQEEGAEETLFEDEEDAFQEPDELGTPEDDNEVSWEEEEPEDLTEEALEDEEELLEEEPGMDMPDMETKDDP